MVVAKGDTCGTYDRAAKLYLIIATGEKAVYANILFKKGVVKKMKNKKERVQFLYPFFVANTLKNDAFLSSKKLYGIIVVFY